MFCELMNWWGNGEWDCDWADTYFNNAFARGLRKNHADRCLANRWLGIIWKMWQTRCFADELLLASVVFSCAYSIIAY